MMRVLSRVAMACGAVAVLSANGAATTPMEVPAAAGSGMYALTTGADGRTYVSWIEPAMPSGHVLRFAVLEGTRWSSAKTIARGENWFVNWADHPSVTAAADGTLMAHWLVNNGARGKSAYGYGIRMARSTDHGESWREVLAVGTQHQSDYSGFVTLLPTDTGTMALYLTPGTHPASEHGHTGEESDHIKAVHAVRFDRSGAVASTSEVDGDACTCCSTSMVVTTSGIVAAYRDHETTTRDIAVVRLRNGSWSPPARVYADNWQINACPTNGPVLGASGNDVAIAWFTAANDIGRVKVAFSRDGAASFDAPLVVDAGKPVGWPGVVALADGTVVVSWLEATQGGEGELRLRRVGRDGRIGRQVTIAPAKAGRSTGVPQLARAGNRLVLVWRASDRVASALADIPQF